MLRMTSKRVKELVDKMSPTVVVCWRRSFMEEEWYELRVNGTAAEKLLLVFRQLAVLSARCRITALNLSCQDEDGESGLESWLYLGSPNITGGQYAERLAEVLVQ